MAKQEDKPIKAGWKPGPQMETDMTAAKKTLESCKFKDAILGKRYGAGDYEIITRAAQALEDTQKIPLAAALTKVCGEYWNIMREREK